MGYKAEPRAEWSQIFIILSGGLSSLCSGIQYGWPSPSIPILISEKHEYRFTMEECSYLTTISPIVMLLSGFPFVYLSDKIGRKPTLLISAIPYSLSFILTAAGKSIYIFYLARVCNGIGDAALLVVLPVYIGEIAVPKVRGIWGNVPIVTVYLGQLLINIIGGYVSLKATAWIFLSVPILFALTFSFVPESPYFYIMHEKFKAAESSLRKLRKQDDVTEEHVALQEDVKRQMSESSAGWKDMFGIRCNRKALAAAICLRLSQQLSGMSCFASYTQYIFLQASKGGIAAADSAILVCAVLLVASTASSCLMDRLGRRVAMILSLASCCAILGSLAAFFFMSKRSVQANIEGLAWVPLVGMVLYTVMFAVGLGLVPTLMLGEVFSASAKSKGSFVVIVVYGISVSILNKLFQVLENGIGLYAPFAFFSLCCLCNIFLVLMFVPETKGKTLEEIQQLFK